MQKCTEYYGGELIEMNSERELYKSVLSVMMIIGLEQNIPCLIKARPVVKLESNWLMTEVLNCIEILVENKLFKSGEALFVTTMPQIYQPFSKYY